MFCGISSFRHVDEDPSAPDSKKKTRISRSRSRSRSKSNPYSSRGLDKFTSVLAELEARKEKIMAMSRGTQQGVAMVHFMYSNSHDWIPIIVRLREPDGANNIQSSPKTKPKSKDLPPPQPPSPKADAAVKQPEKKAKKYWWRGRPYAYMPVVLLLILVCLLMFGRVFAICCTSVWWYSVPMLEGGDHTGIARRRSFKKKEYVRRLSDRRLPPASAAAPPLRMGVGGVLQELASPGARVNHGKRSG